MAESDDKDRRKYSRIPTDQVLSFAPVEAENRLAVSRDVSVGGIRFEAIGCEMNLGDTLRVTFNLGDQTVTALGRVVWAIDTDPITMDIGLEFLEIDPMALRLLEELLATETSD